MTAGSLVTLEAPSKPRRLQQCLALHHWYLKRGPPRQRRLYRPALRYLPHPGPPSPLSLASMRRLPLRWRRQLAQQVVSQAQPWVPLAQLPLLLAWIPVRAKEQVVLVVWICWVHPLLPPWLEVPPRWGLAGLHWEARAGGVAPPPSQRTTTPLASRCTTPLLAQALTSATATMTRACRQAVRARLVTRAAGTRSRSGPRLRRAPLAAAAPAAPCQTSRKQPSPSR
mmetsp:Transcript_33120/g.84077  ORF Transcript_33120/g.84077 Transcript_33120/m.84077 type:complete len:226 (-) Transcript_33120:2286-2963(-)